ncbi:MAG: serine/threonine-protein kinase [Candidatus Acidiferrales bacterium]
MTEDVTGARKGDYLILSTLGAGGMGKVYKVRNTLSDRVEAMKVLLPDLSEQKDLADRFLREIKVLASLHHPNIAELRTALTIGNQLVMIMEYVEGVTLASRLQQEPVRYADTLFYFDQVLAALHCAHAKQIVHRDIKPANIMLTPEGIVKLMDFGIARSGNDMGLTMAGTTLGSVSYMSPEQIRCETIDGRSDIYSVGVSLYESITGQRPFVSDNNFEMMQAHLQIPPTAPVELKPDVTPALNQLILMAMAKEPEKRFQTADALRAALKSVAPSFGEPTPIEPIISVSTLDMTAPPTPRPLPPTTPGSGMRPVTAKSVTARPVTAQPAAAPVAAPANRTPAPQPNVDLPVASAGRGIFLPPPVPSEEPAQTNRGARRGLYIALSIAAALIVLLVSGFAITRWMRTRPPEIPTSAAPETPPATPIAIGSALPDAPPNPAPNANTPAAPVAGSRKTPPVASVKPRPPAPAQAAQNSAAPDQQDVVPEKTAQQTAVQQQPPQPAAPPTQRASPADEQTKRATVATVAQLAAVEREEWDELTSRATSLDARIASMQQQSGTQPSGDLAASQQRVHGYLAQAEAALHSGDVQNAQRYMDQANAEIAKLQKPLPH